MERFINNKYLSSILRPQPSKLCSIVSIASIIKIVTDEQVDFEAIMAQSGISKQEAIKGRVGNDKMIKMAKSFGIDMICYKNDLDWKKLKEWVSSDETPIIFHRKGHYSLVVGFIEEPLLLNSGDNVCVDQSKIQKWIVVAEHRVKGNTGHRNGMLEMVTWDAVKKTIKVNSNCALLVVKKNETG